MKNLILIFCFLVFSTLAFANSEKPTPPNEKLIYYHLHQASYWATLYYKDKNIHAPYEMGIHLGKVKYSEERLVDSKFYKEFTTLYNLIHDYSVSSLEQIQVLRLKIAQKASELKVSLPETWKNEFNKLR